MRKLYYTPHTESVDQFLKEHIRKQMQADPNYKMLHLTPTLILFRKRNKEYQKFFRRQARNSGEGQALYENHVLINEFHQWSKDFVYNQNVVNPLSRSESHVLIKRAINDTHPNQKVWLSTSLELLELFLELQTMGLEENKLKDISPYLDWQQMMKIYKRYNELLMENQIEDFSQALIRLLKYEGSIKEYSEVIFDGPFLFFQPVHELLMERCEQLNIPITFVVPFDRQDEGVNPAYRVIEKTYSRYVPMEDWKAIPSYRSRSSFIEKLPQVIFTDRKINLDETLTIERYQTLEQEIREVVTQIKRKIEQGHSTLNKVAIVTPNSIKIRPLVREISENIGLEVEVPERPFLGLSAGEFIRIIYQTKNDERKFDKDSFLDVSMFRRMISSSWFPKMKKTIASFQSIEEVFFDQVVSLNEWEARLKTLLSIKKSAETDSFTLHPIHSVSVDDIKSWLQLIEELTLIQQFVFLEKATTLGQHGRNLLSGMWTMISRIGKPTEGDEFLQRLQAIVEGISSQDRILVEPQEFGDLLYSLFLEQEDEPEGLEQEEYNPEVKKSRGILVTSLQNIAFQEYNFIYPIQFTQSNYPQPEKATWPVHNDIKWKLLSQTTQLQFHSSLEYDRLLADREKYYFYLSFLSSKIGYSLSFSRFENGVPQYPSHFLNDIATTFGIKEENVLDDRRSKEKKRMEKLLIEKNILKDIAYVKGAILRESVSTKEQVQIERAALPSYLTIEDIALYQLCPKRFQYNIQYPNLNVYSSPFQLSFYLANEIYRRAIKKLLQQAESNRLVEEIERKPIQRLLLSQVKEVIQQESYLVSLFPVSEEMKKNAVFFATHFLEGMIGAIFNKEMYSQMKERGQAHATLKVDLEGKETELTITTDEGDYKVQAKRDFSIQFENQPIRTYSTEHRIHFLNTSKYDRDVQNGLRVDPFDQWLNRIKREVFYSEYEEKVKYELKEILIMMEKGNFTKQKGSHCKYCTFHKKCLENENFIDEQLEDKRVDLC